MKFQFSTDYIQRENGQSFEASGHISILNRLSSHHWNYQRRKHDTKINFQTLFMRQLTLDLKWVLWTFIRTTISKKIRASWLLNLRIIAEITPMSVTVRKEFSKLQITILKRTTVIMLVQAAWPNILPGTSCPQQVTTVRLIPVRRQENQPIKSKNLPSKRMSLHIVCIMIVCIRVLL